MGETARTSMDMLQTYGGWAVSVFLATAFVYFYKDFKKTVGKKDELIEKMNESHHQEMIAVVKECTGVLATVGTELADCKSRQERFNE